VLGFADDYAPFDDQVHAMTERDCIGTRRCCDEALDLPGGADELAKTSPKR
jgi:hypothetical protein